ncbi:hypothetical protein HMI55_004341 [Coelomomyces lativittatus]|nr:hypothetical protein HMI55_004341 [Coelomomyces lativittatus]
MTSSCFFSSSSSSSSLNLSGMEENECMDYEILEDYLSDPHPDLFKKVYQSSFPDGLSFKILRWPLMILIILILTLNLLLYIVVRQCVTLYEYMFVWRGKKREMRHQWLNATTYEAWKKTAILLDKHFQRMDWKQQIPSPHYDYGLILSVVQKLQRYQQVAAGATGDHPHLLLLKSICLESACKSNLGGVENVQLYSHCFSGTKTLIEVYVKETVQAMHLLAQPTSHPKFTFQDQLSFFKKASHFYGRTALCLSGGAAFGYYHLGVVKALLERDLLPSILAGSSAGSMIAAMCCCRTNEELKDLLASDFHAHLKVFDEPWWIPLKRRWVTNALFCPERWKQKLMWVTCGSMTFLEAYKKTGRVLNITLMSTEHTLPATLLNHITTPDVLIWSAVLASCAIPGILPPIQLMRKPKGTQLEVPYTGLGAKWLDGSLRTDIPTKALHREFNVNFTIVSQANPHIHLFFFDTKGIVASSHRGWRGGFILSGLEHYLKLNLMKYLKLLRNLRLSVVGQQDWSSIFLQRFHGSVTIVPQTSILDYFYIFSNPSRSRLTAYLIGGQRNTWYFTTMEFLQLLFFSFFPIFTNWIVFSLSMV